MIIGRERKRRAYKFIAILLLYIIVHVCRLSAEDDDRKLDIAQLFLSYSDKLTARKDAASRTSYNDWVWERVLKRGAIDKKFARGGFNFHHKITTDGVSVSLLYSRSTPSPDRCSDEKCSRLQSGIFPSLEVGLDPGKKNSHNGGQ